MPCFPKRLLILPVRGQGLILLRGRWNMARVICDCAVSPWDSQVSAGKQDKELFSFWPRFMVWKNTISSCQISSASGLGFPMHSQLLSPFSLTWPGWPQDVEIRSNAAAYLPQITQLLNNVPRQMLLLLKTNDLLRGIESALHTRASASSFLNMSRCCIRAVST